MNRVIRKAQTHSSGEASALLAALMATELLQPSRCLWLISPWISDLILLDNSAGTYGALGRWGSRPIRLSEIVVTLLSSSATVVVGTTRIPTIAGSWTACSAWRRMPDATTSFRSSRTSAMGCIQSPSSPTTSP